MATRTLQFDKQLQAFEALAPERQNELLAKRLNHLLGHAKRHAPYWAERLDSWMPQEEHIGDTLTSLPTLARKDLQSRFEEIIADFPRRRTMRASRLSTSGSTGTPVCVEHLVELFNPPQNATMLLTARWHKIDPMKPVGKLQAKAKDNEQVPLGNPFAWVGPVAIGFSRCTKDREIDEIYEYCSLRKPPYLFIGPTTLTNLARYAIRHGRDEFQPEIALCFGSAVTDEIREIVRKGLGTKIIDRYSSEETGIIGIQCPKYDHLHVISPITLVEIVDETGAPCSVGQPGRVLVTNMHSYGMPIIRYDIGDIAEWGEPCDCGITLPVIKKLWGRTRHMITTPDGGTTFARFYYRNFEDLDGLQEYRFVLHQNAVVVAQLKALAPSAELTAKVTGRAQDALRYPFPVTVRYVKEIDWGLSWKRETFAVSDLPPPDDETNQCGVAAALE